MRVLVFLSLFLAAPAYALCGYQNGVYTCSDGVSPGSCSYVNGVYTCSDNSSLTSQYCTTVNGQTVCADDDDGTKSKATGTIDGTNAATVAQSTLEVQSGFFADLMGWLKGALLWFPKWIWQSLLGVLGAFIKILPAPEAFASFTASIASIAGSVIWFLDLVEFKFGLGVVISALFARFLLRRIPLIG